MFKHLYRESWNVTTHIWLMLDLIFKYWFEKKKWTTNIKLLSKVDLFWYLFIRKENICIVFSLAWSVEELVLGCCVKKWFKIDKKEISLFIWRCYESLLQSIIHVSMSELKKYILFKGYNFIYLKTSKRVSISFSIYMYVIKCITIR